MIDGDRAMSMSHRTLQGENQPVGLRNLFRPRQNRFLQLLIKQAEKTLEGMDALEAYMEHASDEHADAVRKAEKEADELRRILIDDLNRTFVTPLDREDIFALSRTIDDVMDYMRPAMGV